MKWFNIKMITPEELTKKDFGFPYSLCAFGVIAANEDEARENALNMYPNNILVDVIRAN